MPRKKLEWDAEQIRQFKELCGIFCTQDEICRVMGVTPEQLDKLLNRHLREEVCGRAGQRICFDEAFARFSAGGRESLRRKQFELAMEGDKSMLVWLGKQYLGQKDPGSAPERRIARERLGGEAGAEGLPNALARGKGVRIVGRYAAGEHGAQGVHAAAARADAGNVAGLRRD